MRKQTLAAILVAVSFAAVAQEPAIEWINSPEAYFATPNERAEWFRLKNESEREAFKKRYWLMRDPTPDTPKNEFKDVILDRIRKADARFSIKDGAVGSRTAQGMVFIVLGPPSFVRNATGGGVLAGPDVTTEATDVMTRWLYDTHRTPHLMEMLGRPELEVVIVIEPTRRRDVLQAPGLFDQYREVLARRSIVNPLANVAIAAPETEIPPVRLNARLSDDIRSLLHNAQPTVRSPEGVVFSASEIWTAKGSSATVSFTVSNAEERTAHLTTYGEVRAGDRVVASIAQPFVTTDAVVAASGSRAEVLRLDLPPGSYQASFALVDDRTHQSLFAVAVPLRVFDSTADFDVSSLLLGQPVNLKTPFAFGPVAVQPRADLLFRADESIWVFALIRSKPVSKAITADIRLRRDGQPVGGRTFAPSMAEVAPGIFMLGEELPAGHLPAGDYSLYLIVYGDNAASEIRRADFRVGS